MTGRLISGTPWGRRAIDEMDPDYRAEVENAIPDGYEIVVTAGRTPGPWTLILRADRKEVRRMTCFSVEYGCEQLLAKLVVEDHGGYVVVADVAP